MNLTPSVEDRPVVTVLMAVRNGAAFLHEAIESILGQTLSEFEFVIVNDASTDDTRAIIQSYNDRRIRLMENATTMGLAASLNRGLDLANGTYIARMDCDDVSISDRLEKQVAFMEANPDVAICGTWVRTIGDTSGLTLKYPSSSKTIKSNLIFDSVLAHPSVMIRKQAIDMFSLRYDPTYACAQDYDLWVRCMRHVKLGNMEEVLMLYRLHDKSISGATNNAQYRWAKTIRIRQLRELGLEPTDNEIDIHESFVTGRYRNEKKYLADVEQWLEKLVAANVTTKVYDEPEFSGMLKDRWFIACNATTKLGFFCWSTYWRSSLRENHKLSFRRKLRFLLKCIVKY